MSDREAPHGCYHGDESEAPDVGGWQVIVQRGQSSYELEPSADYRKQFSWGYEGGGPLSLADALLRDYLGFRAPESMISAFHGEVIADLPRPQFELTMKAVADWESAYRARKEFRDEAERTVLGLMIAGQRPDIEIRAEHFHGPRSKALFLHLDGIHTAGRRCTLAGIRSDAAQGLVEGVTSDDVWMLHDTAAEGPGINFWASQLVR